MGDVPLVVEFRHRAWATGELLGFIPEIRKAATQAKELYLFFNNCHKGAALRNAQTMKELLGVSGPALHSSPSRGGRGQGEGGP